MVQREFWFKDFWFKERVHPLLRPPDPLTRDTTHRGYPIGLAGLQRPERLLTNLLSLSRSLPPYLPRVRHQAHIHDPFDEGLVIRRPPQRLPKTRPLFLPDFLDARERSAQHTEGHVAER